MSTTILLERGVDLIACQGHALRILGLESLMRQGYDPSMISNPERDACSISFPKGGTALFEAVDMGGASSLRIKADLHRYNFGRPSIALEGPERVPHAQGMIDFDPCIRRAADAAKRIVAATQGVVEDPARSLPVEREDASGIRAFTHGGPDAATVMLPDIAAAYALAEMMRLGFTPAVASMTTIVVSVCPDGMPYASLRFDMGLGISDVPAMTTAGLAFLSKATRPSMLLSISDDRLFVKPIRMLPTPLDHGDDPMTGLRAAAALTALGERPEGVLTDKAFHSLRRAQETMSS